MQKVAKLFFYFALALKLLFALENMRKLSLKVSKKVITKILLQKCKIVA